MNAFPVYKSFTAVIIFLIGMNVWGESKEDRCETSCSNKEAEFRDKCIRALNSDTHTGIPVCIVQKIEACSNACISKSEKVASACSAAYKEWSNAEGDGAAACGAFDPSVGGSCSEKVKSCGNAINGLFDSKEESDDDTKLIMAMITKEVTKNSRNPKTGPVACVQQYDTKVARDAEKEMKREKKDLEKDIKKEIDEQAKLAEEQNKKRNEIEKKIAEINKDLKKEGLKEDTEMRKQISESAKLTIDSAKKLRSLNTAITNENNKLAQVRFAHQTAMLALTDEKVALSCKQQLLALKNGILNSGTGDPKAAGQEQIKAIADQIKNQGIKGTGELKILLNAAKKQCFETESTKKNQRTMDTNQKIAELNNNIKEFQSQIDDEKKQLQLSQDNIKKIQDETEKKKNADQEAAMKEISNLNTELMGAEKSIATKLQIAQAQAAKLNTDIQNLVIKTESDVKLAFTDASKAIAKAENARADAYEACNCNKDSKDGKCSPLSKSGIKDEVDPDEYSAGGTKKAK